MMPQSTQVDLTHASFFSGVGGTDLGLERAGWRTVSFSEVDPYASAVLARHWPDIPNLGDISRLADDARGEGRGRKGATLGDQRKPDIGDKPYANAVLWSGGFPCQDLSIAGKRAGLAGARSGLAFAFLDLVAAYNPPWVLLENVPGLLSSNQGRDHAALLARITELGYGVAYRILDARYFGVPQRRRRVFILASNSPGGRAGAIGAAAVLSVAAGSIGDSPSSLSTRPNPAPIPAYGIDLARPVTDTIIPSAAVDARGVRAPDGLAGRPHDRIAATLNSGGNNGGFRTEPGEHLVISTLTDGTDDLLPLGLDSHRYRCCGNGVVSNVAESIGLALAAAIRESIDVAA